MDLPTLVTSLITSGFVVGVGVPWLVKRGLDHGFSLNLATHKSELDAELTRLKGSLDAEGTIARANLESALRQTTERILGEESAERSYRFEAKKRLYHAVGPLRFQLVGASVQFLSRLIGVTEHKFALNMQRYFGRSFLYRVSRLLALTELIERQTVYADFSVDDGMINLLRFRSQIMRALSSDDVVVNHPNADWTRQKEHIFRDQLPVLGNCLVIEEEAGSRVMRFEEFDECLEDESYLEPLKEILSTLHPTSTPILWMRLVAIAQACHQLTHADDIAIALDPEPFDLERLVDASEDSHMQQHRDELIGVLRSFADRITSPSTPAVA